MPACWRELREEVERIPGIVEEQAAETVVPEGLGERSIVLIGSGDSYAAALVAEAVGIGYALDPLDARIVELREPGDAILLSVGGRSKRVVAAAEALASRGFRVIAVTGDERSPLARRAHIVVKLVYSGLACGVGAARHAAMIAALASMLGSKPGIDSSLIYEPLPFDSLVAYTGVGVGVASALYTSLKTCEILADCAPWWHLEQFAHAPVYGFRGDQLVVYPDPRCTRDMLEEYISAFREAGLEVVLAPVARDPWNTAILHVAVAVLSAAEAAEARNIMEPGYRSHPALERLTRLIYLEE